MADQQLATILTSGSISAIFLGGVTSNDAVIKKSDQDVALSPYDTRLSLLETLPLSVLDGASVVGSQQPTTTDSPIQVEFGALQTTPNMDLAVDGTLTCKTAGTYDFEFQSHYGRTGGAGTSMLAFRVLKNGTQQGGSLVAKIDDDDVLIPWSSTIRITLDVNDTITTEVIRASEGHNSGGLFQTAFTIGWNNAPSASIQVFKVA